MGKFEEERDGNWFVSNDLRPFALQLVRERIGPTRKRLRRLRFFGVSEIHDARVEIRRIRATLDLLGPMLEPSRKEALTRRLRRVGRLLSPLRDLDVLVERSLGWELPRRGEAQVDFLYRVGSLRGELAAVTRRELNARFAVRQFRTGRKLLRNEAVQGDAWKHFLEGEIRAALVALSAPLGSVEPLADVATSGQRDLELLHQRRKACRQLRYQLEVLQPVGDFTAAIQFLRGAQERFGAVQDAAVIQERIRGDWGELMSRKLRVAVLGLEAQFLRNAVESARLWWLGSPGWEQAATGIEAQIGSPNSRPGSFSA